MDQSAECGDVAGTPEPARATAMALRGRWLVVARVVWLALVIPNIGFYVISLPVYYQQLLEGCVDAQTCSIIGALPPDVLASPGFPASGYALALTIFLVIIQAIWCGVGFLLFWRRSDDWVALLAAFFLVMFNATPALPSPALVIPLSIQGLLGMASTALFLIYFPHGRLVPRWMGAILVLDILNGFFDNFPTRWTAFDASWPDGLYVLLNFIPAVAIIFSQIYRYRRISTPVQRQQTKWVVFAFTLVAATFVGLLAASYIPSLGESFWYDQLWGPFQIVLLLIPLSIGVSILRYRLYDIDLIINRALVYGTLTGILGALYAGLIIGLESLIGSLTGTTNEPVALVVSTLAIAALFQPVRRRIQAVIDRRFYRRKYDAEQTLAAFSATLRHEVDLHKLRTHLLTVVQETMQPIHVSLWLRQPEQDAGEPAHYLKPQG